MTIIAGVVFAHANVAMTNLFIAGSDNNFGWGDATIHGDTVTVSSSSVSAPTQVHYAYAGNPIGNLCNKEGLPASPFITEGPQITFPTMVARWQPISPSIRTADRNVTLGIFHECAGL